jgi:hypothetical protein
MEKDVILTTDEGDWISEESQGPPSSDMFFSQESSRLKRQRVGGFSSRNYTDF